MGTGLYIGYASTHYRVLSAQGTKASTIIKDRGKESEYKH
ncbi:hypothetical protein GMMP15_1460006 [Candidatus Magnetomoraceae bacterium gMMP-15]